MEALIIVIIVAVLVIYSMYQKGEREKSKAAIRNIELNKQVSIQEIQLMSLPELEEFVRWNNYHTDYRIGTLVYLQMKEAQKILGRNNKEVHVKENYSIRKVMQEGNRYTVLGPLEEVICSKNLDYSGKLIAFCDDFILVEKDSCYITFDAHFEKIAERKKINGFAFERISNNRIFLKNSSGDSCYIYDVYFDLAGK